MLEALGISVAAANITGTLVIGQLPDTVAETSDIPTVPTKVSELENDSGFTDETGITTIVEGVITTDYVNALGISVDAANITGALTIGQLPDTVAETSDIPTVPTKVSQLTNDSGFQNATGVTTIVGGVITTDYVNALGISVAAAKVTGKLEASQIKVEDIVVSNSININNTFKVNSSGNVTIGAGSMNINEKFKVNSSGDTILNSLMVNAGSSGTSVSIDQYGKLRAENAEIIGTVVTDMINVQEVIFDDVISLKLTDDSTTTTIKRTVSAGPLFISANNGFVDVMVNVSLSGYNPI